MTMGNYIDTKQGYLEAKLWHVGADIRLEFNHNYYAVVRDVNNVKTLRDAIENHTKRVYVNCDRCEFLIDTDNNGLCILVYKGSYRGRVSSSVTLTSDGKLQFIEMLNKAIAQSSL
jgi:hypothetical protein